MEEEKMERSKSDIELSTLRTRVSALRNQTTALAAKGDQLISHIMRIKQMKERRKAIKNVAGRYTQEGTRDGARDNIAMLSGRTLTSFTASASTSPSLLERTSTPSIVHEKKDRGRKSVRLYGHHNHSQNWGLTTRSKLHQTPSFSPSSSSAPFAAVVSPHLLSSLSSHKGSLTSSPSSPPRYESKLAFDLDTALRGKGKTMFQTPLNASSSLVAVSPTSKTASAPYTLSLSVSPSKRMSSKYNTLTRAIVHSAIPSTASSSPRLYSSTSLSPSPSYSKTRSNERFLNLKSNDILSPSKTRLNSKLYSRSPSNTRNTPLHRRHHQHLPSHSNLHPHSHSHTIHTRARHRKPILFARHKHTEKSSRSTTHLQSPNSVNTIARHTPHRLLSSVSSSSSPSPTPSLSLSNSLSSAADHNFELGVELQHDSIVSRTSALAHTHAITVHDAHNTHGERTSSASLLNDLHALEKWVQSMQTLDHNELCQHKYAVKQMTAIMKQSAHRALLLPPDTRTSSAPATIKTSSVTAITAAVAVSANRLLESADKDSTLIRGVNTQIQTEKNTGGDKDKEEMRHISNDVHEEGTRRGGSDDDFTANQAVETGRGDADNDNTNNSGGRGGIHISGGSGDEKDEGGPESELGSSLLASMPLGFSAAALTAASSIADNIAAARKKVDVNPNGDVCDPDRLAWQSRATFDGHEWTSLDKEIDPSVIALDDISDLDNSDNSEEAEETEGEDESTQHEKAKSNCDVDKNDREMRRSIEQHKMLEESIGHTVSVAIRSEGAGQCHNFGDDVGSETSQGCRFGDTSMMFSLASSSSPALLATTLSSLDDMDDMDDDVARSNTGARAGADNTANNGDGIGHKTGGVGIDAVGSGVARVDKVEAGRTNVNDKDDERGIGKHDKCSGFADDSDINDDYLSGLWDSNEGGVGDGGIAKLENVNCTSIGSFSLPLHIATGSEDFGVAIGTRNVDVDYAAGNAAIGQSDDLRDVDLSDLWSDDNYSAMMTVHDTDNQHNNPAGTAASVVKNVNANTKKKESQTTSVANVVHEYADDDDINDDDLSGLWDDDDDVDKTNTISLVDDKDIIDNINDARGKGFMKNADDDKLKGNDEDDIDWGTDSEGEGADQDQSKALPSCSSSAPVLAPVAHSDLGARSSVDLHEFQVTAALHSSFLESERQHQEQGLGMVQAACQSSAFEKAFKDVIEAPVPLATLLAWSGDRDQNHHEGRSMDRVKMKEEENMRVE